MKLEGLNICIYPKDPKGKYFHFGSCQAKSLEMEKKQQFYDLDSENEMGFVTSMDFIPSSLGTLNHPRSYSPILVDRPVNHLQRSKLAEHPATFARPLLRPQNLDG